MRFFSNFHVSYSLMIHFRWWTGFFVMYGAALHCFTCISVNDAQIWRTMRGRLDMRAKRIIRGTRVCEYTKHTASRAIAPMGPEQNVYVYAENSPVSQVSVIQRPDYTRASLNLLA